MNDCAYAHRDGSKKYDYSDTMFLVPLQKYIHWTWYYIQNTSSNFTALMVIESMTTEIWWLAQLIYLHVNIKCAIWSWLKSSRYIQGWLNWKDKYSAGRPGLNFPFKTYFVSTFTFLTHTTSCFSFERRVKCKKKNTLKYLRHNSNTDFI